MDPKITVAHCAGYAARLLLASDIHFVHQCLDLAGLLRDGARKAGARNGDTGTIPNNSSSLVIPGGGTTTVNTPIFTIGGTKSTASFCTRSSRPCACSAMSMT